MSRPIRLRVQQTRYPHWGRFSGIGQYLRHLPAERYAVDLRFSGDDDLGLRAPEALRPWLRRQVQSRGMAWYKLSDLAAELSIARNCFRGGADIVHFLDGEHGVQFLPALLRMAPARRPKLVASYHQPPDLLPELVRRDVAERLDRVVLVAPTQRAFFEAFMPTEKVVTILHGIDTGFFRPAPRPKDGVFRCIAAGQWLRDWPTVKAVAERLKDRPEFEFHVVTGQPTGLEGLPNVRFHKGVSDEALRDLYQQADALFLPLGGSTANNSVLEALACGLPIVSTDLPAVRTYLGDAESLLLPPGDVEGSLAALERLRADPGLRAALSAASRRRAEALSWPKVAERYDALYQELAQA